MIDIGGGVGEFVVYIWGFGYDIMFVDGNVSSVKCELKWGFKVMYVDFNSGLFVILDVFFDVVVCFEVIEYIVLVE